MVQYVFDTQQDYSGLEYDTLLRSYRTDICTVYVVVLLL